MSTDQERKVFVMVQTKEAERQYLHQAARAQGYGSLSEFTRAAWLKLLMAGGKLTQDQAQVAQGMG